MAQIKFANNVSTQLTKPVAADDSTIEVRSLSEGLVWPDISTTGDYFLIVIDDISMATWEILKCTNVEINGNATTLTVERGIEGTTPSKFNTGSVVENRLTAGTLNMFSEEFPAVVEIDRGGTGATTVEEARTNLEVPSKTEVDNDISSLDTKLTNAVNTKAPIYHAASDNTYGLGTDALYGHVKGDGKSIKTTDGTISATDIALGGDTTDLASLRGYLADTVIPWWNDDYDVVFPDFDSATILGNYHIWVKRDETLNYPEDMPFNSRGYNDGLLEVKRISTCAYISSYQRYIQIFTTWGSLAATWYRVQQPSSSGAWYPWKRLITNTDKATSTTLGLVKPDDGLNVTSGGTLSVDDTVVRTSGDQTIDGKKTFSTGVYVQDNIYPYNTKSSNIDITTSPASTRYQALVKIFDKNDETACIERYADVTDGRKFWEVLVYRDVNNNPVSGQLRLTVSDDDIAYVTLPTPPDSSNTNTATTTEWVKRYAPIASSSKAGLVKPGTGTSVAGDGALSVDTASTSKKGIVQLSSSVSSTSETTAATSKAVKTAYDKAVAAFNATDIVGEYKIAHTTSISGYLLCNGAAVSRTT